MPRSTSSDNHKRKYIDASLVLVVRNEEDSIYSVLDAYARQTLLPREVIIVDGKSTDRTLDEIERFKKTNPPFTIRVFQNTEENTIPSARNIGISKASYDLIIGGDASVTIPHDWIERLAEKLTDTVDIVAGVYEVRGKTPYQQAIADVHQYAAIPDPERLKPETFHPSNRSLLFRKKVWERLGGYRTQPPRGEDTWFSMRAAEEGFKKVIAPKAKVSWYARKSILEDFHFSRVEALSDVHLGIARGRYTKYYLFLALLLGTALFSFITRNPLPFLSAFLITEILLLIYALRITFWSKHYILFPLHFLTVNAIFYAYLLGITQGWLTRPFAKRRSA